MAEKGIAPDIAEWLGLQAYWCASLFVVVEGWEANRFSDSVIDQLLTHPADYKALLRRFRNAVFHYQPALIEPRMGNFLRSDNMWSFTLHDEFCRFFRDWVETFPGGGEEKRQYLKNIAGIVGWIPDRPAEREIAELEGLARKLGGIVSSDAEKAIQFGLEGLRLDTITAIKETREIATRQRAERLAELGVTL